MFLPVFNLNFLIILLLCHLVHSHDMDYIPENWIDPTDMRNYDVTNKRMRKSSLYEDSEAPGSSTNIDNCTTHAKDLRRFEIFLERFINHVLSTSNLKNIVMEPRTKISSEIPVLITSEELLQLTKLSGKITAANLNELDALFSTIFTNERGFSFDSLTPYLNVIQLLISNLSFSYEKITVLVFIAVCCVVLWMHAVGRELKKIIIFLYLIFFMGGLGWNWWKMYQVAVIEQYSEMQRLSQIPDVCVPKKIGFFEHIFSSSSAQEECRKYHIAFQFDPFSKVAPTIVLSETVSGMFVHPLKALGSSVGEFLSGVNNAASWPFKLFFLPFIYITSVISLLCIIMVCLGVKLNFWTLLGGVSIGGRIQNEAPSHPSHPTVTDEISLRRTIEYDSECLYIITQVGTIRKCIAAVQNEVLMEPVKTRTPAFTIKQRFSNSLFRNFQRDGDKLNMFCDNTSGHSSSGQNFTKNQITTPNESPTVSDFENKNLSIPVKDHGNALQRDKNSSVHKSKSSFGSGDNLSWNSSDINQSIQDHWNNVLRQLNCNTTRRLPTPRIMSSRTVIYRKKYK